MNDKMSYVVGVARMRQLRVKSSKYPDVEAIKANLKLALRHMKSWAGNNMNYSIL